MVQPVDDRVLRAKYLDWCSARVAERFLALTPDQIFELAHASPSGDATGRDRDVVRSVHPGSSPPPSSPLPASHHSLNSGEKRTASKSPDGEADAVRGYAGLVAQVTRVLARSLELPSFEEWLVAYREDPEAIESELLGFWRSGSRLSGGA